MAMINCPECGKEISDRAESCPNCGCPNAYFNQNISAHTTDKKILDMNYSYIIKPKTVSTTYYKNDNNRYIKIGIIALSTVSIFLLLVTIVSINNTDTIVGNEEKENILELQEHESEFTTEKNGYVYDEKESITEQDDVEGHKNTDEEFESISDAFEKGFDDNFKISDENQENIDSIKESVNEIMEDEEVQESYENWKESVYNLFGGSDK